MVYCTIMYITIDTIPCYSIYDITKYGCVFLKLGESTYVAMDLILILLGSLPLAHNAQHSLVLMHCHCHYPIHGPCTCMYSLRVLIMRRRKT